PAQHLAALVIEAREALLNELVERLTAVAGGLRASELDRKQRIAAAFAAELRAIRVRHAGADEHAHIRFAQRPELDLLEQAGLAQLAQRAPHGGVVAHLVLTRREDAYERLIAVRARDVVQRRRARLVAPMKIVEQHDDGLHAGSVRDELAQRAEQAVAVRLI